MRALEKLISLKPLRLALAMASSLAVAPPVQAKNETGEACIDIAVLNDVSGSFSPDLANQIIQLLRDSLPANTPALELHVGDSVRAINTTIDRLSLSSGSESTTDLIGALEVIQQYSEGRDSICSSDRWKLLIGSSDFVHDGTPGTDHNKQEQTKFLQLLEARKKSGWTIVAMDPKAVMSNLNRIAPNKDLREAFLKDLILDPTAAIDVLKVAIAQYESDDSASQLETLQGDLEALAQKEKNLDDKLASTENKIGQLQADNTAADQAQSRLEEELRNLKTELQNLGTQRSNLLSRIRDTDKSVSDTAAQLREAQRQLAQTQDKLEGVQHELSDTERELNDTRADLSQTKDEIGKTKNQLSQKTESLNQIHDAIEEAKNKLSDREASLSGINENINNINHQISQAEEEHLNAVGNLKDQKAQMVARLKAQRAELVKEQARLENQKEGIISQRDRAQAELEAVMQERDKLRKQSEALSLRNQAQQRYNTATEVILNNSGKTVLGLMTILSLIGGAIYRRSDRRKKRLLEKSHPDADSTLKHLKGHDSSQLQTSIDTLIAERQKIDNLNPSVPSSFANRWPSLKDQATGDLEASLKSLDRLLKKITNLQKPSKASPKDLTAFYTAIEDLSEECVKYSPLPSREINVDYLQEEIQKMEIQYRLDIVREQVNTWNQQTLKSEWESINNEIQRVEKQANPKNTPYINTLKNLTLNIQEAMSLCSELMSAQPPAIEDDANTWNKFAMKLSYWEQKIQPLPSNIETAGSRAIENYQNQETQHRTELRQQYLTITTRDGSANRLQTHIQTIRAEARQLKEGLAPKIESYPEFSQAFETFMQAVDNTETSVGPVVDKFFGIDPPNTDEDYETWENFEKTLSQMTETIGRYEQDLTKLMRAFNYFLKIISLDSNFSHTSLRNMASGSSLSAVRSLFSSIPNDNEQPDFFSRIGTDLYQAPLANILNTLGQAQESMQDWKDTWRKQELLANISELLTEGEALKKAYNILNQFPKRNIQASQSRINWQGRMRKFSADVTTFLESSQTETQQIDLLEASRRANYTTIPSSEKPKLESQET